MKKCFRKKIGRKNATEMQNAAELKLLVGDEIYSRIQSSGMEERKMPEGLTSGGKGCLMLINLSFVHIAMLRDNTGCLRSVEASVL